MYDIDKRRELKNATVGEIIAILETMPRNTKVFFNGNKYGYIHIEEDMSVISFDDNGLDELYRDRE